MEKMIFSLLEQHKDGSWWYHPGMTYATAEEAEAARNAHPLFKERPYHIMAHTEPIPQDYSLCTYDFATLGFGGIIEWPKSLAGEIQIRRNIIEALDYCRGRMTDILENPRHYGSRGLAMFDAYRNVVFYIQGREDEPR